ncbi:Cerato-platanin [Tricharina praecox]|uniref:Cerato-platanin n=1 Tax=Tricharina praecox TaxID=43433 RepID=UPI00221EF5F8|nr:Cerato-platanin [Tricharina praecox]KAI5856886.1 Cerato-platanin [Tricharina praecox]
MQFTSALLFFASTFAVASAGTPASVRYDTTYDTSSQSTLTLACSDGANGLYTKGYETLGELPSFPNVGAAAVITGWNSAQCGTCFKLYYQGKTVYITGVDVASGGTGFVLSRAAMNTLTGGLATQVGTVTADYAQVASSFCGL